MTTSLPACDSAFFEKSDVDCTGYSACRNAQFITSAAQCSGSGACAGADFDDCSCCDGEGCGVADLCNQTFCAKESASGETCKELGNPFCDSVAIRSGNDSSSAGKIGIAIGAVAAFVLAIVGFVAMKRRKASRSKHNPESPNDVLHPDFDSEAQKNTLVLREGGKEEDVGDLLPENLPISSTPLVFLSCTDRDAVKGEIARPTHWFLTSILEVEAFLDEYDTEAGSPVVEALVRPANTCTHALVILSPSFRKREFCVRELNTFMARLRSKDGISIIPALWLTENVEGYHRDVDKLIWVGDKETRDPATYMVHTLWPVLVRQLGGTEIGTELLEKRLVQYVQSQRGLTCSIPSSLERFARNRERQTPNVDLQSGRQPKN